jgi:O-antigen ligase
MSSLDFLFSGNKKIGSLPNQRLTMIACAGFVALAILSPLMTVSSGPLTGEGSIQRQLAYLFVFIVAVIGAKPQDDPTRLFSVPLLVVATLGWCWLSVTWSIAPNIAVRRLLLTTMVVWSVFLFVRNAGYTSITSVLRWALVITLIANYIIVFADPSIGLQHNTSALRFEQGNFWCGLMVHKNFAGAVCALTALLFIFDAKRVPIALRILVVAAAVFFLIQSQSKTSAGVGVIAIMGGVTYAQFASRYRAIMISVLAFASSVVLTISPLLKDWAVARLSDPAALTGRGNIWNTVLRYAADEPLTGAGFGSFWNVGPDSPVYHYGTGFVTEITSGHNGYIDLTLGVGIPGMTLAVLALIIMPLVRLLAVSKIPPERGALVVALLLFCVGHNATESSLLERDQLVGVFLLFANAFAAQIADVRGRAGWSDRTSELSLAPVSSQTAAILAAANQRRRARGER